MDNTVASVQVVAAAATVAAVIVALSGARQSREAARLAREAAAAQFASEREAAREDAAAREESLRRQITEERRVADRRLRDEQRAADHRLLMERDAAAAENTRLFVLRVLIELSDLYGRVGHSPEAQGQVIGHVIALPSDCAALLRHQCCLPVNGEPGTKLAFYASETGSPIGTPVRPSMVRHELAWDLRRYAHSPVLPLDFADTALVDELRRLPQED